MTTSPSCKNMTFCEEQTCQAGLQQKLQGSHKHRLKVDKQRYFHCRLTINQNMPTNEQMIVHHLGKNRSKQISNSLERHKGKIYKTKSKIRTALNSCQRKDLEAWQFREARTMLIHALSWMNEFFIGYWYPGVATAL